MTTLIDARGIAKRYRSFELQPIDLTVEEGSVVGLVGANGAGKTTLLKSILDLVSPDAGEVSLFGERTPASGVGAETKQRIGSVFDTCPFPVVARVSDVRRIGRACYPAWDDAEFTRLSEWGGFDDRTRVKTLSRGMGMKLQLAFALAHRPRLLILDEATAGLDPIARTETLDLLREFVAKEGCGILLSTHITTDLERLADAIVCLEGGKRLFSKPIDEVCDIPGIAHCTEAQLERLIASGAFAPGELRLMRKPYSTDALVPDRAAAQRAVPGLACDRPSIDEYLLFTMKGETR